MKDVQTWNKVHWIVFKFLFFLEWLWPGGLRITSVPHANASKTCATIVIMFVSKHFWFREDVKKFFPWGKRKKKSRLNPSCSLFLLQLFLLLNILLVYFNIKPREQWKELSFPCLCKPFRFYNEMYHLANYIATFTHLYSQTAILYRLMYTDSVIWC